MSNKRKNDQDYKNKLMSYFYGCLLEFLPFSSSFFNKLQLKSKNNIGKKNLAINKELEIDNQKIHLITGVAQFISFCILIFRKININEIPLVNKEKFWIFRFNYNNEIASKLPNFFCKSWVLVLLGFIQNIFKYTLGLILLLFFLNRMKLYYGQSYSKAIIMLFFFLLADFILTPILFRTKPYMFYEVMSLIIMYLMLQINSKLEGLFPIWGRLSFKILILFFFALLSFLFSVFFALIFSFTLIFSAFSIWMYIINSFSKKFLKINLNHGERMNFGKNSYFYSNIISLFLMYWIIKLIKRLFTYPNMEPYLAGFIGVLCGYFIMKKIKKTYDKLDMKKQTKISIILAILTTILFTIIFNGRLNLINRPSYLLIGATNSLAMIPGVSRMMTTASGAFFFGLSMEKFVILNYFLASVTSIGQWVFTSNKTVNKNLSFPRRIIDKIKDLLTTFSPSTNIPLNLSIIVLLICISLLLCWGSYFLIQTRFFWSLMIVMRFIFIIYTIYVYKNSQ